MEQLDIAPLTEESLTELRKFEATNPRSRKGLYVLFLRQEPVYVG